MKAFILVLMIISFSVSAQTDFYYQSNGSKTTLKIIENVHLVHFKNGLGENGITFNGYQFAGNYYIVLDLNSIPDSYSNYNVSKAYESVGDTMYESDEIVLLFKNATSQAQKNNLIAQYNLVLLHESNIYERYEVINASISAAQIFESGLVKYCHPNFFFKPKSTYSPNDLYFNKQFYLHNTGQTINDGNSGTTDADMDVVEAWDITKGDSNIIVAVVDRGITSNHVDLPNSRQVRLPGGNLGSSLSNNNPNDLTPDGNHYHGDPCAGVIGATQDNAIGISGIAPLSKIMPVKFEQGASASNIADCITFADTNGAQILSGSVDLGLLDSMKMAVIDGAVLSAQNNGMLMFFAAGNTRFNITAQFFIPNYIPSLGYIVAPANTLREAVVTVGAGDRNDQLAIYSPIGELIDIVAPSSKTILDGGYTFTNTSGSLDVWSSDNPDTLGSNAFHLGGSYIVKGERLPNSGLNHLDFTGRFGGTSAATPMVAGVAALVLSVNDCLSNLQVKDILLNTADKVGGYNYNWNSTRPGHSKEFGYGRVNAHKAVLAAQSMQSSTLDLMIKDVPEDFGDEPDTIANHLYLSEDIWVRNQQDGLLNQYHENPEYDSLAPVYVYVRVKNKSCVDATPNDSVTLHWAKASTALSWPHHWNGSLSTPLLLGDSISTVSVGNLEAGTDTILEFTWLVPNYTLYTVDPSHFCLLARVKSTIDTMTFPEDSTLWKNVRNNNNIAWKNVTVVNSKRSANSSNEVEYGIGAAIGIGNDQGQEKTVKVKFKIPEEIYETSIVNDAEITIKLDQTTLSIWENGGSQMTGMDYYGDGIFKVQSELATLENLIFEPYQQTYIFVGFNFLTTEIGEKVVYKYYVEEFSAEDEFIGGEEYFIYRDERPIFYAEAGSNEQVNQGQPVNLQAQNIGEPAIYNWYDENGDLFYSGTDTSFVPSEDQKYLLEIIALKDGFKDYDEKEITIKDNYISSVSPNPISNSQSLLVNYVLESGTSAQLVLSNSLNTVHTIYTINSGNTSTTIPISNMITGVYSLTLIVNGEVLEVKTIIIN